MASGVLSGRVISSLLPELPPALFLNLFLAGLQGKLRNALGELSHMAAI
jgi:hypothetical protein